MLEVYPIGSQITIKESISGQIIGIFLRTMRSVEYECSWWDGNVRRTSYLKTNEFELKEHETQRIGFK